jgi:hypothetical protein
MRALSVLAAASPALALGAAVSAYAFGQTVDVERPRSIVVGTPAGGASMDRVDGARTGRVRVPLPAANLRREWQVPLGVVVDHGPLVDARGTTYVVGVRGEVVTVGRDGIERWRVSTGAIQPGPAALLSDDTLVFVDASGEAVAVRDGAERWRVRFGRSDEARPLQLAHPAPLALADGGVVVATPREISALDADGHERARTTLPEPTAAPLISALGKVVAVTTSGAVWTWTPGAPEPTRVGSFGSAIDEGAALADDHTLVAVAGGQLHLAALDLVRGTTTTRAVAPAGTWLGPPAMRGSTAYLLVSTPNSELAVAVDASGSEVSRAMLAAHTPPAPTDAGIPLVVALPHTPPLVDAAGTLAFATSEGSIGVASGASVELTSDVCPSPIGRGTSVVGALAASPATPPAPVAGLAPLGPGAFVAVCRGGVGGGSLVAFRAAGPGARSGEPGAPHL